MLRITSVIEYKPTVPYLEKRNLMPIYYKAKENILAGNYASVHLKKRKPTRDGVFQFRITQKYRAFGMLVGGQLRIFEINDHQ